MEPRQQLPIMPVRPDPDTIDPSRIEVEYDRESDTFHVDLFGAGRRAKVLHVGSVVDLRLDPGTHVIVGYQIEGFLTAAVYRHPELLEFAALAGISEAEIAAIRQRITPEQRRRDVVGLFDTLIGRELAASA